MVVPTQTSSTPIPANRNSVLGFLMPRGIDPFFRGFPSRSAWSAGKRADPPLRRLRAGGLAACPHFLHALLPRVPGFPRPSRVPVLSPRRYG